MATAAEIRQAVDTKLANLWSAIQTRQDSYFSANGRFWQGIRTHSATPADGTESLPDVGTAQPHYQSGAPWPTGIRTTALPMSIEVHQYDGPAGRGYQATVYVTIGGRTWTRTAQSGPETWRAHGWTEQAVPL